MEPTDLKRWLHILSEQEVAFTSDALGWKPPLRQANSAWHPPCGAVFKLVDDVKQVTSVMNKCAEAVVAVGAAETPPSVGSIKAYLSKLLRRKLPYVIGTKVVAEARNPWLYMEAGLLIKSCTQCLGDTVVAVGVPSCTPAERWVMKPDLALLKAEARKGKIELEKKTVSERLAVGRAEKAEELCAVARSELDIVMERASELEAQLNSKRARSSNEVYDLRRQVKKLTVDEGLAFKRAAKAEERLALALSQLDMATKHATEASMQTSQIMEELSSQRAEMELIIAENERLQACASRSYTAALSKQVAEQEEELHALRQRRANNMSATKQLNLERQRCTMFKQQVEDLREIIRTNWGRETLELAEKGTLVPGLEAQIVCLKQALHDVELQMEAQHDIIFPPKPMEGGCYDMKLRFTIMKLVSCANVCHTRVPEVLAITSAHWGIVLPGRYRKVLVNVVNGIRHYETKWRTWTPCRNTCENIRYVQMLFLSVTYYTHKRVDA